MATSDAPVSVGTVTLIVNSVASVGDFYQRVLGLDRIASDREGMTLGQGEMPLVHLVEDRAAQHRPDEAGLFHTAFLLPHRADLGRWLRHAAELNVKLDGASDHLVSEALYLQDPEGNGVEIYADRDRSAWDISGDQIRLDTRRLDLQAVSDAAPGRWTGLPEGSVIGHVHLQVGEMAAADAFFTKALPMKRTAHLPSASFYGSGGYHHHLAGNIWHSRGSGQRSKDATGLAEVLLLADPGVLAPAQMTDPWGTRLRVASHPKG